MRLESLSVAAEPVSSAAIDVTLVYLTTEVRWNTTELAVTKSVMS